MAVKEAVPAWSSASSTQPPSPFFGYNLIDHLCASVYFWVLFFVVVDPCVWFLFVLLFVDKDCRPIGGLPACAKPSLGEELGPSGPLDLQSGPGAPLVLHEDIAPPGD